MARGDADLSAVASLDLPREIRISVPEGYAFYALYPESYQAAARQFAGAGLPKNVCVIGIRSIGTSLSAVVAAALEDAGFQVRSWTVRPQGHPFDRHLSITAALADTWRALAATHAFAIVDEGPGLSGSSFIAVASRLRELGVPENRIVLFPSWEGNAASFVNERARSEWPRYRKFFSPFHRSWIGAGVVHDLSGGEWRRLLYANPQDWPAVQPQHEARKYLDESGTLYKFAGLGPYGREKWIRACLLSEAGYGPRVYGLRNGFLERQFVRAHPANTQAVDASLLDAIARYASYRRRLFPGSRSVDFDTMLQMIEVNSRESGIPVDASLESRTSAVRQPTRGGGRRPHDAARMARNLEGLDQSGLGGSLLRPLLSGIRRHRLGSRRRVCRVPADARAEKLFTRAIRQRVRRPDPAGALMRFYETAYIAFRVGYANMAANSMQGTADGDRFRALEAALSAQIHQWQASA